VDLGASESESRLPCVICRQVHLRARICCGYALFLVCNRLVSVFYQVMEVREAIEEAQSTKALQELRKAVSMEQSAYPSVQINFGWPCHRFLGSSEGRVSCFKTFL
jgi:hypothetical protein